MGENATMNLLVKKTIYNLIRGVLYGVILLGMGYIVFFVDPPTSYVITEQYTIKAPEKSKFALSVLVPKTLDYQQVSNLRISGGEKVVIRDTPGLQVVMLELREVKDTVIRISYDVYLPEGEISWAGNVTAGDLSPQQGIESDHPELIAKSKSIASGQTLDDAEKIYKFVSTWLKWPRESRTNVTLSALNAYQTKIGGCHDFAQLLTAMLRAQGIPARSISGLALPLFVNFRKPDNWNHQAGAHAWVEFHADGKWHFSDPSWGGSRYFNRCDGLHLSYGEEESERQIFERTRAMLVAAFTAEMNADSAYAIVGAMTAPLKFIAVANDKQVKIIPTAMVKIKYGYRLPVLLSVFLFIGVVEWLIRRKTALT